MTAVNSYLYRLPRFDIDFALEFEHASISVAGRCKNLSDTGLFARFAHPIGRGNSGVVRLLPATIVIELNACVTHTDGLEAGLSFDFRSDQELQLVRALVKAVSRQNA